MNKIVLVTNLAFLQILYAIKLHVSQILGCEDITGDGLDLEGLLTTVSECTGLTIDSQFDCTLPNNEDECEILKVSFSKCALSNILTPEQLDTLSQQSLGRVEKLIDVTLDNNEYKIRPHLYTLTEAVNLADKQSVSDNKKSVVTFTQSISVTLEQLRRWVRVRSVLDCMGFILENTTPSNDSFATLVSDIDKVWELLETPDTSDEKDNMDLLLHVYSWIGACPMDLYCNPSFIQNSDFLSDVSGITITYTVDDSGISATWVANSK